MKLFTKIFLQVTCVILILSSAIFFYTSYRWEKQSIQYINNYEYTKFQNNLLQFEEKLRLTSSQSAGSDERVRNRILIYAFRQIFHDSAVLYQNGEELHNGTTYNFDVQGIQKQMGEIELHGKWYDMDTYVYDPIISKIDGRTLLLFYYSSTESTTKLNYQIVTYKDISDVLEKNQILFYQAGALTLIVLLLTGTILFFSLRKIMAPLTRLKEAAVSVSEGNYDIEVPAEGNTELAQVGKSFNQMSAKVKEQVQSLSTINQTQRQLMGSLAHELKTPMTSILGYADTLLTVRLQRQQQERALSYISNECRRLSRLSVKMLELTGLYETGEARFAPAEISVKAFLEDARQLNLYRLREKNIHLELQCDPTELKKTFDKDLMLSVLNNFIDNAVKASLENSKIILSATAGKLMVQDFGKGIPAEDLEKVTEAFYMVDKSRSRANGSVGLELALCKKIADIHGFQLKIESELGEGTRIFIEW